ncbi:MULTISPECIES: kynureninase [Streptomyces]|uniref:Kynureninase n=1 Tax=Streptomyces caniscabiei TaxID=2746961 RepID=A0ABU4MJG3_9ACTN|nr:MULTISPECIES: kynureninase [Streptomyces]MBE4735203.1 kynureninase [Streptomyces caniscabiei]MBE4754337.1 kynureninase [Streptomyces caniscabiei]MBE4767929.1 kynureninase [Streptomyces caniscabiei]MBE4784385.1 kynureninase [Streptomyces caniscabiei]MBE4791116.1 kynureninase [Streptomyces caniscabiei]
MSELISEARELDAADQLACLRTRFVLDEAVYLDGNSLGALPVAVPGRVADVVYREWGELRIRSWDESGWWTAPERIGDRIAPLVGAAPGQIVVGDSTSVNVFKAVVAAVRMAEEDGSGRRDEILVDATTFPTDGYLAESAARMTGRTLRPVTPAEVPAALSDRTAAVLLNHVDYRTGRLHDLPGLTAAVHEAGAYAVWDLCHSAGALPVGLDAHGVDLAVGCTYKYLNGGPGSPAYLYVRRDLQPRFDSPLPGWTSHAAPFAMRPAYEPAPGAVRGRVGTPDILSMLALEAALDVWYGWGGGGEAGPAGEAAVMIESVRAKSLALTDFFLRCVAAYVPEGRVESLTPAAHAERGSQVALRCDDAGDIMKRLISQGVIGDFRHPDVLRFGFTPLYVSFTDVERAARVLAETLEGAG